MNSETSESNESSVRTLCPSCSAIIAAIEVFCPKCGAPVSALATLDPMQAIRAEGFLLQKATETRPKLIVLIGMWMLFLPFVVVGPLVAVDMAIKETGMVAFFFFWGGMGLGVIGVVVLFKVTRNYFKKDAEETGSK